jgi:hypothetical protein
MRKKISVRERDRLSKDLAMDASLLFQRLEASNAALVGAGKTIRRLRWVVTLVASIAVALGVTLAEVLQ